jgi:hypothetical protein
MIKEVAYYVIVEGWKWFLLGFLCMCVVLTIKGVI